ncbi:ion channel [Gloeothece verrucosa]|uniref:Ion transport 2 domain protein n=1 Tax=Gloeothece verrucosa (strain PCC 7822) TaxID=497965 RepID=E0U7K0_GLOV7|nr:ion channel [Gloeothece verrucosa]ADN13696.1 Ion transport 2 domain protein [Gloeothece verrucosa PCC 7822]
MKPPKQRLQKNAKTLKVFAYPNLLKRFKPVKNDKNFSLVDTIWHDLYHWLLSLSWPQFLLSITLVYLTINFLFALVYLTGGDGIANAHPGSLTDAFFFSIQTLSTVGYGSMYPQTLYTQILVTVEILFGLVLLAILTGLMFARFSKPTARVMFSKVAVICPYNGIDTFMFRVANQRDNQIIEAQVKVNFLANEVSHEGHQLRRFYDVNLIRSQTPVFGLSWLVMHPIDENSPFWGKDLEFLNNIEAEIWVSFTGIDDTFSQTVHARHSYAISDLVWNRRFVDIFARKPNGQRYIDLSRFHDVIPL